MSLYRKAKALIYTRLALNMTTRRLIFHLGLWKYVSIETRYDAVRLHRGDEEGWA